MIRSVILSLSLAVGLAFPLPAYAQSEPIELTDRQAKRLSGKLCRALTNFNLEDPSIKSDIGTELERHLLFHSGVENTLPNYKAQLADFWNANSYQIICKENFESTFPEQHFFSRAVRQNFSTLVLKNYFFSDAENSESFPIDPNIATENQYGIQETVLDYIDRVLLQPDAEIRFNGNQIREVRDIIENDFGGKRARELP